jgi:hypothetical protein
MATKTPPRLYFAYGSNLSLAQMKSRCPTSTYHSFGFLRGYKWIIGERGYANVVKSSLPAKDRAMENQASNDGDGLGTKEHVVYGMLYTLEEEDEENLDVAEGVPYAYLKRELDVVLVTKEGGGGKGEVVKALVYVDEKRVGKGVCKEEYVARMNRGIRDAMAKGMDREYVDRYIRPFVREEKVHGEREVHDPFHPNNLEAYEEENL